VLIQVARIRDAGSTVAVAIAMAPFSEVRELRKLAPFQDGVPASSRWLRGLQHRGFGHERCSDRFRSSAFSRSGATVCAPEWIPKTVTGKVHATTSALLPTTEHMRAGGGQRR